MFLSHHENERSVFGIENYQGILLDCGLKIAGSETLVGNELFLFPESIIITLMVSFAFCTEYSFCLFVTISEYGIISGPVEIKASMSSDPPKL